MTKHGGTFKFSGETRELLRNNKDFFDQLTTLNVPAEEGKVPPNILGKDRQAQTEAKIQANGDVEVTFVYPIDDYPEGHPELSTPEDGRVYLRDTFVFDSSESILKDVKRSVDYNGKGQGPWQARFEQYKAAVDAAPLKIDDEKVKKFAMTVARSFGRPITDETGATLPEIREVWVKDSSYITAANVLILKQREENPQLPELKLKVKDKLNNFALVPKGDTLELVFTFAVDNDDDPANGRLLLKDKFVLDPATMAFKELKRSWQPDPESGDNADLKAYADKLQAAAAPTPEEAQTFLKAMLPVLLGASQGEGLAALAKPAPFPKDYQSPLAKRLAAEHAVLAATPAGAGEALDAMYAVALDSLAQRHDASLGWYNRKIKGQAPIDIGQGQALLQSVFQKATEEIKAHPAATAFAGLRALQLEGAEAALRDRLLADPRMAKIDAIGSESDLEFRAREFLTFAREDLLKEAELGGAAMQILKRLAGVDAVKGQAEKLLAVGEGRGSFGTKMEFLVPRFAKQVADPKMLAAMGVAPFLGWGFEFGTLRWLSAGSKVSGFGRTVASLAGIGGEAFAFTAMHRGLESAVHDPAKLSAGFWQEVGGASLLFSFMRGGHAVSGRFTRSLAEGKWGGLFGGRASAEGLEFIASPTGRILVDQSTAKALTKSGSFLSGLSTHGGGIFAMYAAGAVSRKLGWQPDNKQSLGEHWFEAAVSYGQATAGFGLANALTGGKLQGSLADLKLRTSDLGEGLAELKSEKTKRDKPITLKPKSQATKFEIKAGPEAWTVDLPNIQKLWIGRGLAKRPGVGYGAGEATLNVGDDFPDVNQYHALLLRDQAGIFWYIADTGSVYGTYVNGRKLPSGGYTLAKPGTLVQLGDHFQFRLETDGALLEPDPRVTAVVQVPIPRGQKRLEPPKPADVFPFDVLHPDKSFAADANVEIGELKSLRGTILPLRSGKPVWNLSLSNGAPPIARVYADAKGRWILQKLDANATVELARRRADGEQRWKLEKLTKDGDSQPGVNRQDWVFLEPGDQLFLQHQIFEFLVHPEPKDLSNPGEGSLVLPSVAGMEVPLSKVGQALDPNRPDDEMPTAIRRRKGDIIFPNPMGMPVSPPPPYREAIPTPFVGAERDPAVDAEAEVPMEDRITREFGYARVGDPGSDSEATRPGIPIPIDIPDLFPELMRQRIPTGEVPFVLVSGSRGMQADLRHTRYLIGSNPEVSDRGQIGLQVEGARVDPNHAEIFLGRKPGSEDYQWFLAPHEHSESGVFVDGYRRLKNDERIPLTPGRVFSLGDAKGQRGGIQFSFEMPWLKKPAAVEARPASVFPAALLSHLEGDAHAMALRSNPFGSYVLKGDRVTTRYVIGTGSAKPAPANTGFLELENESGKIAPEHCEIFVDSQGQWYLRALSETQPTYLRGKLLIPGVAHPLVNTDAIELGGDPVNGIGLAVIFHKPEYLRPDQVADPADVEDVPDSNPVLLGSDQAKTVHPPVTPPPKPRNSPVIPPPPDPDRSPTLPRVTPPPLPQVPAPDPSAEKELATDLKTGVYSVQNDLAGLLAKSALGAEPEPVPAPVTGMDVPTVKPRPAAPPPKPAPEPPPPAQADDPMADWGREFAEEEARAAGTPTESKPASAPPPAPVEPEESFAGITEAVLAQAEGSESVPADSIETIRAEPPRIVAVTPADEASSQGDGVPTLQAEVPRQVSTAAPAQDPTPAPAGGKKRLTIGTLTPEQLRTIHPDLTSAAILPWLQPLLQTDRAHLRPALDAMKVFPELTNSPSQVLSGSTENPLAIRKFFNQLTGFNRGGEEQPPFAPMTEDTKFALLDASAKLDGTRYPTLEADAQYLKISSFPTDGAPDTLLTMSIRPGAEPQAIEAAMEALQGLNVPVETLLPLAVDPAKPGYLGLFFRSEDAAQVLATVRSVWSSEESHGMLEPRLMPFSHQLLDAAGRQIPGMSVMEFDRNATYSNPLQARAFAVAGAYNSATRAANQTNGTLDKGMFRREILRFLDKLGYDLNNPGFRKGSVEGSHREIAAAATAMPVLKP